MIKIFIFDDHDSVRESYKRWLEIEGYKIVGAEGTTKNCIRKIKNAKPDIIMMDIDFPEKERAGIVAAQKITKEIKNAKIIFVSHYNEQEIIVETLKSGASGYFAKSDELKYLKETIENVYKGNASFSPSIINKIVEILKENNIKTVPIEKTKNPLTEQENIVLNYIAQGLTNKEIANNLTSNEKNVKNIVTNLFFKIEAKNRAHAIAKGIKTHLIDTSLF